MRRLAKAFIASVGLVLSACSAGPSDTSVTPNFHPEGNPPFLSDWGVIGLSDGKLVLSENVIAYDLNTPLFSDYAHKLRAVWVPDGTAAQYHESETFDFPVGTVISKTFYYPKGSAKGEVVRADLVETAPLDLADNHLIETRILARRIEGWVALPYVWNEDQTDAQLKRIGDIKALTLVSGERKEPFNYVVPNANQCAGCHATNATTKEIVPIGPKARHLNKSYGAGNDNQLDAWRAAGLLSGGPIPAKAPKAVNYFDVTVSVGERARAYLDINCAHCHNKVGPADTSGLHFEPETQEGVHLGVCKLPIAAGNGTGGRSFDIVPGDPDNSIMVYRMASTQPSEMMPELGRSLAHDEGVALMREWVAGLDGVCG